MQNKDNLKLIFGGKLLTDEEILESIFSNSQNEKVVYVVMSPPSETKETKVDNVNEGLRKRYVNSTSNQPDELPHSTLQTSTSNISTSCRSSSAHPSTPKSPTSTSSTPPFTTSPNPHFHYHGNSVPSTLLIPGLNGFGGDMNMYQWYNPDQMMWMQQQYVQYMNQYMQYMQRSYQADVVAPLNSHTNAEEVQQRDLPINAAEQPINQEAPLQQQQPQVQRMNAQGGALMLEDDDDGRNRDWLDWAYVLLRFSMLMCILYFYSTPTKFLTFILLSVLFFLYQTGWLDLPIGRGQVVNQQQNAGPPQRNDENLEEENANIVDPAEANAQPADTTINQPANQQPGVFSLFLSLIVSFFTSLAPQVPPPINAN